MAKEHYIVTVDRGNLRIYAEAEPWGTNARLEVVESVDLPAEGDDVGGNAELTAPTAATPATSPQTDGRVDVNNDGSRADQRANSDVLATELDFFLQTRPGASWDVAAAPALFNVIIGRISAGTRQRLRHVLSKVLVNDRAEEVRAQFAALAPG